MFALTTPCLLSMLDQLYNQRSQAVRQESRRVWRPSISCPLSRPRACRARPDRVHTTSTLPLSLKPTTFGKITARVNRWDPIFHRELRYSLLAGVDHTVERDNDP